MYREVWLWEAQFVMFYESLRLWEVHGLTNPSNRVGALKKDFTCVGDLSWDHMRFDECSKTSGSGKLSLSCLTRVSGSGISTV